MNESQLRKLSAYLYREKQWPDVVPVLEECVRRFPDSSASQAVQLAAIAVEIQSRPQFALRVLDSVTIPDSKTLRNNAAKLRRIAGRMIAAGTIEIREANGKL